MGLKDEIKNRGAGLIGDPRVFRALQSERLSGALTALMGASGRLSSLTAEQRERVARMLGLATPQDLEKLERRVTELEAELRRLRAGQK